MAGISFIGRRGTAPRPTRRVVRRGGRLPEAGLCTILVPTLGGADRRISTTAEKEGAMLRNLGAAVLGYVAMLVVVMVLGLIMALVVGGGGAFIAGTIVVNLVAAILGGIVCAKVAADGRGVLILMAAVVVIAVVIAVLPDAPVGEMMQGVEGEMPDMMDDLEQPAWMTWANPLVAVLGVYVGSRLVKKGD